MVYRKILDSCIFFNGDVISVKVYVYFKDLIVKGEELKYLLV